MEFRDLGSRELCDISGKHEGRILNIRYWRRLEGYVCKILKKLTFNCDQFFRKSQIKLNASKRAFFNAYIVVFDIEKSITASGS